MEKRYPGGKRRAFNITYDDGVEQDLRFVALLNRYGIRGTFHLNSGLMARRFSWTHENGMQVTRLTPEQAAQLYRGHEVASHTVDHPYMQSLTLEQLLYQLGEDRRALQQLTGQEVRGFAVPFDYFDERIAGCARACGFEYARTSEFSLSYTPCADPFRWQTGVYHIMPQLVPFFEGFLETREPLAVCQIVGHSYDLDALALWDTLEAICARVSRREDVWLCTNLELVRYLNAMAQCVEENGRLYNPSSVPLWFARDDRQIVLAPGEAMAL